MSLAEFLAMLVAQLLAEMSDALVLPSLGGVLPSQQG
jgi:hypothetical protein